MRGLIAVVALVAVLGGCAYLEPGEFAARGPDGSTVYWRGLSVGEFRAQWGPEGWEIETRKSDVYGWWGFLAGWTVKSMGG